MYVVVSLGGHGNCSYVKIIDFTQCFYNVQFNYVCLYPAYVFKYNKKKIALLPF